MHKKKLPLISIKNTVEFELTNIILPVPVIEGAVPAEWPQNGDIRFEGISLRYDLEREPVITKLDLAIPAGQKVSSALSKLKKRPEK